MCENPGTIPSQGAHRASQNRPVPLRRVDGAVCPQRFSPRPGDLRVPRGSNNRRFPTIAAASIPTPQLPPEMIKRLPRYPTLPAVRIGRLAVDLNFRGRGLGAAMLADAASRALQSPPAVFALLVDAKNDAAVAFYLRFGFQPFASQPRTLFLPMATAGKLVQ